MITAEMAELINSLPPKVAQLVAFAGRMDGFTVEHHDGVTTVRANDKGSRTVSVYRNGEGQRVMELSWCYDMEWGEYDLGEAEPYDLDKAKEHLR